jgi:glycosyltransferase involved in cell wall biosynthesis
LEVLQDDELRSRLSAQALEARHQYYWDVLVHQFAEIYKSS